MGRGVSWGTSIYRILPSCGLGYLREAPLRYPETLMQAARKMHIGYEMTTRRSASRIKPTVIRPIFRIILAYYQKIALAACCATLSTLARVPSAFHRSYWSLPLWFAAAVLRTFSVCNFCKWSDLICLWRRHDSERRIFKALGWETFLILCEVMYLTWKLQIFKLMCYIFLCNVYSMWTVLWIYLLRIFADK